MNEINENSTKPIMIKIYYDDLLLGTATGFQIHKGHKYLVTNWHVVSGKNFITKDCLNSNGSLPNKLIVRYKKYIEDDKYEWIDKEINLYDSKGNKLWYEHPSYGDNVDVAIILLEEYPRYSHYKERFNLDTNYNLDVTESVFVLGFPLGYTIKSEKEPHAVWTSGTVASDPPLGININGMELPGFLIDSKTRQGQSGSPVIYYSQEGLDNHCNGGIAIWGSSFMKEIGIYSGRIHKDSDLGYVWKWSVIKEISDTIKI
jgi:hypothetical protein